MNISMNQQQQPAEQNKTKKRQRQIRMYIEAARKQNNAINVIIEIIIEKSSKKEIQT